jgi:hypothetical protein
MQERFYHLFAVQLDRNEVDPSEFAKRFFALELLGFTQRNSAFIVWLTSTELFYRVFRGLSSGWGKNKRSHQFPSIHCKETLPFDVLLLPMAGQNSPSSCGLCPSKGVCRVYP